MNYKPVSFEKFKKEALDDSETKTGYEELEEEFALIMELIKARKIARKTQHEVAKHMHTSQAMIARIENGFNEKRHSPTLGTVRKYAKAVGCRLSIKLIPEITIKTPAPFL
ncbi:MAG: transcriptional regulator, XRE family [uncultured bacterium]|nr:MAG: transcriptional regulator, XRE family [uncultured bacterium]